MDARTTRERLALAWLQWGLIAAFFAATGIPPLLTVFSREEFEKARELRQPTEAPGLPSAWSEVRAFPAQYEEFYNDHFRGRSALVRMHSRLKVYWFGVSPIELLMLGTESWIYLGNQTLRDTARNSRPFTTEELERWRLLLERRQRWCGERGIEYVFCIAPEKSTIYPEHLAERFRPVRPKSRLDELIEHLQSRSSVRLLDLRPALLREKAENEVYYPLGSHWNDKGSFFAYRAILECLHATAPELAPLELSDFEIQTEINEGDNLATRMYLDHELRQVSFFLKPKIPIQWDEQRIQGLKGHHYLYSGAGLTPLRAVIFRDSFGTALYPYLLTHFSATAVYWRPDMLRDEIEKHSPRFVLQEMAERELMDWSSFLEDEYQGRTNAAATDFVLRDEPANGTDGDR